MSRRTHAEEGSPDAAPREHRFFLRRTPEEGAPELEPEEVDHLVRVLRLRAGDAVVGLDGTGSAWPLRVERVERRGVQLAPAGPARTEPAPGEAGAPLPWIEVAVALPRPPRAEDMLDRLCQLGVSAVQPLVCERSHPRARALDPGRRSRLERVARASCKQAGRLWLPVLAEPATLEAWLAQRTGARLFRLDPGGERPLAAALAVRAEGPATRSRPLVLVVGPEGGLSPPEVEQLDRAGAAACRLGPHVLRVATAAEAAAAVATAVREAPAPG